MCTTQELQVITKSVVKSVIDIVSDRIYKIVLYGSYTRGDFTSESDIDIMISIALRDKESFCVNQDILPFYQNVEKEGVELYG